MKIIGKTEDGFLLEASKDDVALMMGFRYAFDDGFKNTKITIGTEMSLTKMAATSEFLRNIDKDRLKEFKSRIEYVIDDIDRAIDTITELTIFETLKDAGK